MEYRIGFLPRNDFSETIRYDAYEAVRHALEALEDCSIVETIRRNVSPDALTQHVRTRGRNPCIVFLGDHHVDVGACTRAMQFVQKELPPWISLDFRKDGVGCEVRATFLL